MWTFFKNIPTIFLNFNYYMYFFLFSVSTIKVTWKWFLSAEKENSKEWKLLERERRDFLRWRRINRERKSRLNSIQFPLIIVIASAVSEQHENMKEPSRHSSYISIYGLWKCNRRSYVIIAPNYMFAWMCVCMSAFEGNNFI